MVSGILAGRKKSGHVLGPVLRLMLTGHPLFLPMATPNKFSKRRKRPRIRWIIRDHWINAEIINYKPKLHAVK
ncbi:unnamed protein product [Nezara viridula]|uniref:Uncharacterized protein n=1 Tax=Nezara viridula TaxID=85310 RepID=A0A9P0E5K7_NEZVI|nr:unnamed protein product [Nezara viridula]